MSIAGLDWLYFDSVILHLKDGRTDEETCLFVRPTVRSFVRSFVSLSVVSARDVQHMGERTAMLHGNLRGDKNPVSTNEYTKFGQLLIGKIIKIIAI